MSAGRVCRRALVSGLVQGVGFRASTAARARALDLAGYARNLPDGRVEVVACGSGEAVQALCAWLADGPRSARVDSLELEEAPELPEDAGFRTR